MNERADEMAIRALIDERVAAMRHKDAARAIATLAPDVVAFEPVTWPPGFIQPRSAMDERRDERRRSNRSTAQICR